MLRNIVAERVLGLEAEVGMEFGFSDEQQGDPAHGARVPGRSLQAGEGPRAGRVGQPHEDEIWKEMCELGWPGIAIAEDHGGQGLGLVELVILLEQSGYALAPSPLISNAPSPAR